MSSFITTLHFIMNCLPDWVSICLFALLGIVTVLIVLAVVKAVLDAIPFV